MSIKNATFFPQNFIFSNLYRFAYFCFLFYGTRKYNRFFWKDKTALLFQTAGKRDKNEDTGGQNRQ